MGELQGVNVDRQACASSKTGIAFWTAFGAPDRGLFPNSEQYLHS